MSNDSQFVPRNRLRNLDIVSLMAHNNLNGESMFQICPPNRVRVVKKSGCVPHPLKMVRLGRTAGMAVGSQGRLVGRIPEWFPWECPERLEAG